MDPASKISFNNKVISQERGYSEPNNSGFNVPPYKRILSLVKEANPNGLRNFLEALPSADQFINQTDQDLRQTPIYQAVQIKNKTVGYSVTNILLQYGVKTPL